MKREKRTLLTSGILLTLFAVWTIVIQNVDVHPIGQGSTNVGLATLNGWFHKLTGVHMQIYVITDWLGLVPIAVCMVFAGIGFGQLVKRRSFLHVDGDIIILGIYYVIVMVVYLVFEIIPINYRPILIEGRMETSYPSSTTLLVLSVMMTLVEQVRRRVKNTVIERSIRIATVCFTWGMVLGRLICGVHWVTDIIGGILLSCSLFWGYKSLILLWGGHRGIL